MVLIKFHCKNKKSRDRNIRSLSLEQIINKKIEIIVVMHLVCYWIQKLCLICFTNMYFRIGKKKIGSTLRKVILFGVLLIVSF